MQIKSLTKTEGFKYTKNSSYKTQTRVFLLQKIKYNKREMP